ncbi:MAG: hypothetical protein NTV34_04485, partial [Proteobacteria bacterium]|nr:hypothetical protein [Pseudomonadota bacterium]
RLNDGGIYDPAKNSWTSILRSSSAPAPRVHHSSVWTGNKLVVWGGHPNNDSSVYMADPLDTGGVYEPLTKTWTNIPLGDPNQPAARGHHTAIWTGDTGNQLSSKKMLIWGGCRLETADACAHPFGDGAFFDPETLKWSKLTTSGPNPTARHNFSAVYAPGQARLYIFGGFDRESNVISEGAFLDLYTLTWFSMAAMTEGRFKHQAVWAGDKMMIFGGKTYNTSTRNYELASSVVAYIPPFNAGQNLGRWIAYKTDEMEMTRLKTIEHSAVWTGRSMIVWGGQIFDRGFTGTGSQFFPGLSTP